MLLEQMMEWVLMISVSNHAEQWQPQPLQLNLFVLQIPQQLIVYQRLDLVYNGIVLLQEVRHWQQTLLCHPQRTMFLKRLADVKVQEQV